MNYRHAYHAGNFADCLKHAALVAVLMHLRKKDAPFAVIDTHAGRGLYDLGGEEARKTGEAKDGILHLLSDEKLPPTIARYCEIVRASGKDHYPGSPLIAAKMLRAKDRLIAIEKQPGEHSALAAQLKGNPRCRVIAGDGYVELKKLLPPPEKRGCVLIDPPFEKPDEFREVSRALVEAHARFPQGVYLFWYPAKEKPALAATIGELMNAGIAPVLKIEFDTGGRPEPVAEGRGPRLTGAGLLAINPPFGLEADMRDVIDVLTARLSQGSNAHGTVEAVAR